MACQTRRRPPDWRGWLKILVAHVAWEYVNGFEVTGSSFLVGGSSRSFHGGARCRENCAIEGSAS
jgi:hypothetical protein